MVDIIDAGKHRVQEAWIHRRDLARALIHCTAESIPDIDYETETLFEMTEWLSLFKTFLPGLVTTA